MSNNIKQRKIILDLATTLDGFIEGKNGEVDWCIMDTDMGFNNFLNEIDTILYGRKSYDLWGQYIPSDEDSDNEKEIWKLIHSKEKYVFSRTKIDTDNQAIFINENNLEDGGASLITTFINLGLVDEFRLSVHPVVLGEGKPLFIDINQRLNLKLVNTRKFSSGVVQLIYHWDGN